MDTGDKQRLLQVNTATGNAAPSPLTEMPFLKHKDHGS